MPHLGKSPWETPLGVVTAGMETLIDTLYTGYGDQAPFNAGGVDQRILQNRGNEYLRYGIHGGESSPSKGLVSETCSFP